jgi:Mrp family chromosome partitioning ATPase
VIDTPPLAAVSDALNLLSLVDGVLYVIKFNTVKRKTAIVNVRRLWESNTPVFGAILNNITSSLSSYYYSHYSDKSYQDYYIHSDEELENEIAEEVEPEELQAKS